MKIRKIHLHPFAGTPDRTFTFSDGLNVLSGENEFGKSTLYNALQEVLFTGTNLTPALLRTWGNRWFPKPGGDHARVSLSFEADGKTWHLEKVWGAGQQSLLREEGGNSLADPAGVAEKIRGLLKWNEATWKKVLFTRQSELAKTIDELGANLLDEIDDLETRLKGMAAIPGDVPAEQLKALLDAEIKKQNIHWNADLAFPEDMRGINNPWKKEVGITLQTYYEMELAKEKLDSFRQKVSEIQAANDRLEHMEQQVKVDREFCIRAETISSGLSQRGILEGRLKELQLKEENARKDFQQWPVLIQEVKSMREVREKIQPEIDSLMAEQNIAQRRENEQHLLESYQEIVKECRALDEMKKAFSVLPKPDSGLITEWEEILKARENTLMQITALKLKVSLLSKSSVSARIQEGVNPEQSIELEKEVKWESEASGRFRLQYQGLELTIENGELDMDSLTEKLESLQQKESEVKSRLGYETTEAAKQVVRHWEEKRREAEQKESLVTRLLRQRSREQWETWHAEFEQLPATRSSNVLSNELQEKRSAKDQNDSVLKTKEQTIAALESAYGDYDTLTEHLITIKTDLAATRSALAPLPQLPQGYQNIAQYLAELGERKERNSLSEDQERKLKDKIIELTATMPDDNTDELEADFLLKERNFHRQKERSHALLRIRKTLDKVLERREEADPQQILAASVSSRFKRLSRESYHSIRLGEDMQAEGKTALPFHTLSRGTLGSLALAMRLSLGDLYLDGMKGMLLLDDPFTEMDEGRRTAAIQEIKAFSAGHQVLLITCHDSHKSELLASGAVSIKIDYMNKPKKELKIEEPSPKAQPELSSGEKYWKKLQELPYSNDRIGQGFVIGIPLMKPNTETSTNEKPEGK